MSSTTSPKIRSLITLISISERKQTIHALSQHDESILEVLKKNNDVAGFQPAQVLEERVKAHLIVKSDEWKRLILAIEKHSFFKVKLVLHLISLAYWIFIGRIKTVIGHWQKTQCFFQSSKIIPKKVAIYLI